jgi:hypothetical protein
MGVLVHVPALLPPLAEALSQLGQPSEALDAVDEGLETVRTTLSRWQAPELWRVRGELLAARGDPTDDVESSFETALENARAQGSLAFELRAATALARHLDALGRRAEARARLAAPYEAFSEGLETADLRTARALLRKLGWATQQLVE